MAHVDPQVITLIIVMLWFLIVAHDDGRPV